MHRSGGRLAACLVLALACAGPAGRVSAALVPAAPEGHWSGEIQLPGTPLRVEVDLLRRDEGWSGEISIPAQQARDLPLADLRIEPPKVAFTIEGVPGTPSFDGTLEADGASIRGTFTQAGASFAFRLQRGEQPADRARAALAGFDEVVRQALADFDVPGASVAVVAGGQVVHLAGYGLRDVESQLPVTPETLFSIGSCTKAFTTFVLGTLVQEGKLDWDAPVASLLPGFRLYDRVASELITPRDLVTHRSGLPRHDLVWYNNLTATRRQIVERLPYLQNNHTLRARFQYNNLMYVTAGYLAEHLTGRSWEESVRERIFTPLGMRRSNFSVQDSKADADHAEPYEMREEARQHIAFRPITTIGPAGSINSSAAEMTAWLQLHLSGGKAGGRELIGAALLADLHSPHMPLGGTSERPELTQGSYGLGWFVDGYRGHRRVHHGGGIDGFSALVTLLPDDGLGLVVLTNLGGSGLPELLVRTASDRLLGLEPIDWLGEAKQRRAEGKAASKEAREKGASLRRPGTSPAHALEEYAGEYEHPGYGVLGIAVREGRLEATFNGIALPLEHWHYEVFNGLASGTERTFEDTKLLFRTDVKGQVAAVEAAFEPQVADIEFVKRPPAQLSDPRYLARLEGEYELPGQTLSVALAGDRLTLSIPGQPMYRLKPLPDGGFVLEEYSVVVLRFEVGESGPASAVQVEQSGAVYTGKRKQP